MSTESLPEWARYLVEHGRGFDRRFGLAMDHEPLRAMIELDRYLEDQAIPNPLIRPRND